MCIYSKSSSRSLCYNSLPVTCVSVLIKCSVMPKSQLCTHARSSAFPCLFSRHFTECVFCIKKEQLANVLMKETGGTYACVRSPRAPLRFTPPLSRPSAESPNSRVATARRRAHTDTHRHTNTPRAGREAQPGPKSTDELV